MLFAVFFDSTLIFMPLASFDRTTRCSIAGIVASNVSARATFTVLL